MPNVRRGLYPTSELEFAKIARLDLPRMGCVSKRLIKVPQLCCKLTGVMPRPIQGFKQPESLGWLVLCQGRCKSSHQLGDVLPGIAAIGRIAPSGMSLKHFELLKGHSEPPFKRKKDEVLYA